MPPVLYSSLLFVHVFSAVFLVGSSLHDLFVRKAILSASTISDLRTWLGFAGRAKRFNPLSAIVLLVTGIALGSAGWWTSGWFYVSVVAWVMNSALAGGVIKRLMMVLARTAATSDAITTEIERMRRSRALALAENALLANDVVILFVMMSKPELATSVALLTGANVVAFLAGAWSRPRAEGATAESPSAA